MIKPESLWGLFKTCKDSAWLGDVCRALGRQDVELDYGQQMMLTTIQQDSGWMDERIEDQRIRWAERQRKSRASRKSPNVTQCHSDNGDTPDVTIHPSTHPSNQPSNQPTIHIESVSGNSRSLNRPDVNTVVQVASTTMGVPDWYAEWWYRNVEASGWVKTNGQSIDRTNWRAVLKAWWNRADDKERQRIQEDQRQAQVSPVRSYGTEDWRPCEESCGLFEGGRCVCGYKTPPQYRVDGFSPENCQHYNGR